MVLYQEHPPCPALAPYLVCLWTCLVQPEGQPVVHRVLPDNCIDILWQDCDPLGGVAGMMSCAIHVPVARPVRTVAVRFKPGAAAYFFELPLHELMDAHPPLDALWDPALSRRIADDLWTHSLTDAQARAVLERILLQRLRTSACRPGLVEHAVDIIAATRGAVRIDTLAAALGVSRQHLTNQFRTRVGLGAKLFARVCRFQHASARLRSIGAQQDMAALAIDLGYHDQPHMNHEFKALSGVSPQLFAAERASA